MKKMIKRIGAIALSCLTAFCMTACDWSSEKTDGEFIFKYENLPNSGKCYSITGSTEEGQKYKENVYVPTHFNGLPVYYTFTSYTANGGALGTNTMRVNCKKLYFNYIYKYFPTFGGTAEYAFLPKTEEKDDGHPWTLAAYITSRTVYVGGKTYEYAKAYGFNSAHPERFEEIAGNVLKYTRKNDYDYNKIEDIKYVMKANTSYLFNYDNAPNEDYFFINNFEWGGLIEDTPYKPIREGYTFAGWYKEPKCVNAWDFEKDTLPTATYNEEGYVTNHIETKLYAKWIEN